MNNLFTEQKITDADKLKVWLKNNLEQVSTSQYKEKILVDKGCIYDDIYGGRLLELPEDADPYHKLYLDYVSEIWASGHLYGIEPTIDEELPHLLQAASKNQVIEAMSRALLKNLHFNFLNLRVEFRNGGQSVSKHQLNKFFALMVRTKVVKDARLNADFFLQDIVDTCIHYPSIEWANGLSWDGIDTYEGMFKALGLTDEFSKKIFLTACKAAMNRWANPGADNHNVSIFQGRQGARKSSFIRALSPLGSFYEADEFKSKDDLMKLHKHLLVELGEFEQITSKKDCESIKFFITKTKDDFRIPYAELPKSYLRAYSIWGTANSENFLKDQTGSRRFFVIRIPYEHIIDVEWVEKHREQFWAQIHEDASLKTYLDKPDENELQELNKGMYLEDDLLERIEQLLNTDVNLEITKYGTFRGHLACDTKDNEYPLQAAFLYRVAYKLGINTPVSKAETAKIGRWLNANGFTNKMPDGKKIRRRVNGKQFNVYVKRLES